MIAKDRKSHIIQKAIEYFSTYGFSASTREIAKHCGFTQPLIYHYFGSKESLIEHVHQEVFYQRWNPNWETNLLNTDLPLEERLVAYLEDYTNSILKNDWVRLFVFSALNNPNLNQNYTNLLKTKIFIPFLTQLRSELGLNSKPTDMDIELFWGFHSSFFYMGMRQWVYKMDVPKNISEIIKTKARHFLLGYKLMYKIEKDL